MLFETNIRPRFAETDGFQHIGHTVLPVWFEAAREPLFLFLLPETKNPIEWPLIIPHFNVDLIGQIYLGEDVRVTSRVSKIGNTSFTIYQEAFQASKLVAKGEVVSVKFDYATNKPVKLSGALLEKLQQALE